MKNKQVLTSFAEKQNILTQATKGDGQNINVNIHRGEWKRGCRAAEPGRPHGVKVARIYLLLFPARSWSVTVCFSEAVLRSLGCYQ